MERAVTSFESCLDTVIPFAFRCVLGSGGIYACASIRPTFRPPPTLTHYVRSRTPLHLLPRFVTWVTKIPMG